MILASTELEKQQEHRGDDEDDYGIPRSFMAPDDTDAIKSTIEELEQEIFDILRKYNVKLNPEKYAFEVSSGKFIGFMDQNNETDALANLESSVDFDEFDSGAVVQLMNSIVEEGHAEVNSTSLTWNFRNKYIEYLKKGKLPSDPKESRILCAKAARFGLVEGQLFRRSFFGPLARCLGLGETEYAMREVHEGTCRKHAGVESFVWKLIRVSYY
uniref:Uncharacterized protein n=1 Tax=Nicotiana tabacum TaxID=4097 RepID=A0A1S3Z7P2_TOBAC|nr:PREDICTED: uncharacterized protein LOC107783861 [Nicotiana tabacum]